MIVDQNGNIEQRQSFDSWGQRRNGSSWSPLSTSDLLGFNHSRTTKGFGGHEMLDEVGIVHMGGRIYDAKLGRFLQADPLIQAPGNTQSYNRYSYTFNSPLSFIDPTGYQALSNDSSGSCYSDNCGTTGYRPGINSNFVITNMTALQTYANGLLGISGNLLVVDTGQVKEGHRVFAQIGYVKNAKQVLNALKAPIEGNDADTNNCEGQGNCVNYPDVPTETPESAGPAAPPPALTTADQIKSAAEETGAALKDMLWDRPMPGPDAIAVVGIKSGILLVAKADTQLHHAWPKYLGGPVKQSLVKLNRELHQKFHAGLDAFLPRRLGSKYYQNLAGEEKQAMYRTFETYVKKFDEKFGTNLYQAAKENGFPGAQ